MVRGAQDIIHTIKDHLNIDMDETSADGLFTLSEVECLGACVNAPMMQINNEYFYEDLTPENTITMLDKFKKGEHVEPGPQIDRNRCEGPMGRTSLDKDFKPDIFDRDFAAEKQRYDAEKAAASA